jgi:2-iminobutanoate/2-iminopropanoate deaminase
LRSGTRRYLGILSPVNAIYARYFPEEPPARIFVCVPEWFGPFDIEIDCVAVM